MMEIKKRTSRHKPVLSRWLRIFLGVLLLTSAVTSLSSQPMPAFTGVWKQDNDRCQPKRNGDVTLRIDYHGPDLTVDTSISRGPGTSRHAVQKYRIGGSVSISTGTDGDEFHTSVLKSGSSLVFSTEEHEEGRIIQSKETWSILEDGKTLEKVRERSNGDKQTLVFRRIQ
jgi:hypothetical protein